MYTTTSEIANNLARVHTPEDLANLRSTYPRQVLSYARCLLSEQQRQTLNALLKNPLPFTPPTAKPILWADSAAHLRPLHEETALALDCETTGLDFTKDCPTLVQFYSEHYGAVLARPDLCKDILKQDRLWVLHNAKFDLNMLRSVLDGEQFGGRIWDTMLAAQMIEAGQKLGKFSLEDVAIRYAGLILDKSLQASDWAKPLTDDQIQYAALDVEAAWTIYLRQISKVMEAGLKEVSEIEFGAVRAVADMEWHGITLDSGAWQDLIKAKQDQADALNAQIQGIFSQYCPSLQGSLFGEPQAVNLASPKQLAEALGWLGITATSTGKEILDNLKGDHPVVPLLMQYRIIEKLLSAFGEGLLAKINPKTGRIHPSFRQLGSEAGRMSCTAPNLQQIPREAEYRQHFVAAKGYKLVICDYSQMEIRIAAEIAQDQAIIAEYRKENADIHTKTAGLVLGKPESEVTKADRQIAKAVNFGLIFGSGSEGLRVFAKASYGVIMSSDEAERFREGYFAGYPGLAKWHAQVERQVRNSYGDEGTFMTRTLAGRRRFHPQPRKQVALNTPVQGTGADITKLAMAMLWPKLQGTGARLLLQVHDELVLEVPEDSAKHWADVLSRIMVEAGQRYIKSLPIEADSSIGDNWADK